MTFEEACAIAKQTVTAESLREKGVEATMAILRERLAGTQWTTATLAAEGGRRMRERLKETK